MKNCVSFSPARADRGSDFEPFQLPFWMSFWSEPKKHRISCCDSLWVPSMAILVLFGGCRENAETIWQKICGPCESGARGPLKEYYHGKLAGLRDFRNTPLVPKGAVADSNKSNHDRLIGESRDKSHVAQKH